MSCNPSVTRSIDQCSGLCPTRDRYSTIMPGPRNKRKKGSKKLVAIPLVVELPPVAEVEKALPPPPVTEEEHWEIPLPQEPPIYDPGNGPRVKNINAFFASSFCSPPSFDDELCAEFAQEEMLDMLYTVLPHELALVSLLFFGYAIACADMMSNSVCGITKAGLCPGYVPLAGDYTARETCYQAPSKEYASRRIGITPRSSQNRSSVDFVSTTHCLF